ncbi:DUF2378 family protein [bacterium]|nr:DUF2378 family protein [bacterium]
MALCKAAGVIHTRTLLRAKGEKTEHYFLDQLTSEEKNLYQTAMPVSMLPLETAMKFYSLAVPLVYMGSSIQDGLTSLAYDTAKNNLQGIYKILVRFSSPETVIKQTAKIWKTYHSKGAAVSEQLGPQQGRFTLTGYPDIPDGFEYIMDGFIQAMVEMTGVKTIEITHNLSNRDSMTWDIQWE